MKCSKCGKTVSECSGWLERVNEKGVAGVFECRPACTGRLPKEEKLLGAIFGPDTVEQPKQNETGERS